MSIDRDKLKEELKAVIVAEMKRLNLKEGSSTQAMMHSHDLWLALIRSGKMPKVLTYDDFMRGMTSAALNNQFENIFGG